MCIHVGGLFIENTSPQIWNILTHLISTGIRAISGVFLVKCSRVKLPDLLITCLSQPWPSKTSQGKIYVSVAWRCESNLKIYRRTLTWVFPFSVTSHFHSTTFIWQVKKKVILEKDHWCLNLISRSSNSQSADTSRPGSDTKTMICFLIFP